MSQAQPTATYVLDASVAVKWYMPEEHSDRARAILQRASAGEVTLAAPELLWAEVANTLWKRCRRGEIAEAEARRLCAEAMDLPIRVVDVLGLLPTAMDIALGVGCAVYDAVYLALAQREVVPLLTSDDALMDAAARGGMSSLTQALSTVPL